MTEHELIDHYIELDRSLPIPRTARLRDSGVSVWALIPYYQAAGEDVDRVAADYGLSREAVEAALAYYRCHQAAIDARIEEHVAAVG